MLELNETGTSVALAKSQRKKAEEFRGLHQGNHILVLPNCWDVPSARVFEDAGFPAIATSSAGLLASLGYPDDERIDTNEFMSAVRRIVSALSVPVSVDVLSGFGQRALDVSTSVRRVIDAGAVGINIEDSAPATNRLHPIEAQCEKLRAIRNLAKSEDVPLLINARTDALLYAAGDERQRLDEAIHRANAYADGGADCAFPLGLTETASISRFVAEVQCPVSLMVQHRLPPIGELERLGVARVSMGPAGSLAAMGLLKRAARELRENGTYKNLLDDSITYEELNKLALPKR